MNIHIYREFWSASKPVIEDNEDKYHSDKEILSDVDTMNFLLYGLAQFVAGAMGDSFPLRIVLPLSYLTQMCVFLLIALTGFTGGEYAYV